MDRDDMVDAIIEDMRDFLKRDPQGFWDHIACTERAYLSGHSDKEISELYEECTN